MAMNKIKSPLVKILRKSGYSVKDAMNITIDAHYNFHNSRNADSKHFNELAKKGRIGAMFPWNSTPEGHNYWKGISDSL